MRQTHEAPGIADQLNQVPEANAGKPMPSATTAVPGASRLEAMAPVSDLLAGFDGMLESECEWSREIASMGAAHLRISQSKLMISRALEPVGEALRKAGFDLEGDTLTRMRPFEKGDGALDPYLDHYGIAYAKDKIRIQTDGSFRMRSEIRLGLQAWKHPVEPSRILLQTKDPKEILGWFDKVRDEALGQVPES